MSRPRVNEVDVPREVLEEAEALLDRNRPGTAWKRFDGEYPLLRWPSGAPRTLAARLVSRLGADRQGAALHLINRRQNPNDARCLLYASYSGLQRPGPLPILALLEAQLSEGRSALADTPEVHADLIALQGFILALYRDFRPSLRCFDEAEAICPQRPWVLTERAGVLCMADRHDEGAEVLQTALQIAPDYRPARLREAVALLRAQRIDEARCRLEDGHESSELGDYALRLCHLHSERDRAEEAERWLDRYSERMPLVDKSNVQWVAARRADFALLRGDLAAARRHTEESGSPFHERVAAKLAEPGAAERKRVRLPVETVRQHHMTCAPATLTAIASFWQQPAEHLEIAEKICYDGTPNHSERAWAESSGFVAREFQVTWEAAKALIDRGAPFTLATVEPTSAHLQAVIGYDDRAGLLIVRDPDSSHYSQAFAEGFLNEYAASGPRGMVFVPEEKAALLEGMALPEASLYDELHVLQSALERHDREVATAALRVLEAKDEVGRATGIARRAVACYDDDPEALARALDDLRGIYPEDDALHLAYLRAVRATAAHDEVKALLEEKVHGARRRTVFLLEHARFLSEDARELPAARDAARRVLRAAPLDAEGLRLRADLLWKNGERLEALRFYRFASTLEDKREDLALSYFDACRGTRRAEEGLAWLRERFEALKTKSPFPGSTLVGCLDALDRPAEADAVLREALARRPDDGRLLLYEARRAAAAGRMEGAVAALQRAEGQTSRAAWLRVAALLAAQDGRRDEALAHWQEVIELEPLATDAYYQRAQLLAESDSREAALASLVEARKAHPAFVPLAELHVEWLRGSEEVFAVLDEILARRPANAWAWRELALAHRAFQRLDDSLKAVQQALVVAPDETWSHGIAAVVQLTRREVGSARSAAEKALRLDVNNVSAFDTLLGAMDSHAERLEALRFIQGEMHRQVLHEGTVEAFHEAGFSALERDEMRTLLQAVREARPDLAEGWSVLIRHWIAEGDAPAALEMAEVYTQRFPHLPDSWFRQAQAHRLAGVRRAEIASLRRALEVQPTWTPALRRLSEVLELDGQTTEAIEAAARAARIEPLAPQNHGVLADALWRLGRRDEALEAVRRAVDLAPGYSWAWSALMDWGRELGKPDLAIEAARDLAARRPHEVRSWMVLADLYARRDDHEARLEAITEGLKRAPHHSRLLDDRAVTLSEMGRVEEALRACNPPEWEGSPPLELRGRAAWIRACSGNVARAISDMEALVESEPDYGWGLEMLARWLVQSNRANEALPHARRLASLAPLESFSHGLLAYVCVALKQSAEAAGALERAVELDPDNHQGAEQLFGMQLESGDLPGARGTLELMRRYTPGPHVLSCEASLAIAEKKRDDFNRAVTAMLEGGADHGADTWELAGKVPPHGKFRRAWNTALDRTAQKTGTENPAVGALWGRRMAQRKRRGSMRRVLKSALRDEALDRALQGVLHWFEEHKRLEEAVILVRRYRKILRTRVRLWGSAGAILTEHGKHREAAAWLADWREREGLEPWMLVNLCHSLDATQGPEAAAPVRRHLIEKMPAFPDRYLHLIGLAYAEALAGEPGTACSHLPEIDPKDAPAYYQSIHHLTRMMLVGLEGGVDRRAARDLAAMTSELTAALDAWPNWRKDKGLRHHVEAALRTVAARSGDKEIPRSLKRTVRRHGSTAMTKAVQITFILFLLWVIWTILHLFELL